MLYDGSKTSRVFEASARTAANGYVPTSLSKIARVRSWELEWFKTSEYTTVTDSELSGPADGNDRMCIGYSGPNHWQIVTGDSGSM